MPAKEDRRTGERKRTAILRRCGRVDEALESRREQLRRHFRGRLHPLQGGKVRKKESDTTAALLSLIADYITPQKLSIKCVRTDNSGEFEGEFQRELDRRSITHEHTPPDTPQYNGVAERALGLLREKAIILMEELDDVINMPREKLWAQAMLFACDVTNKSVTTSTDGGKSPYELWFGKFPTADHLRPFGAVRYA